LGYERGEMGRSARQKILPKATKWGEKAFGRTLEGERKLTKVERRCPWWGVRKSYTDKNQKKKKLGLGLLKPTKTTLVENKTKMGEKPQKSGKKGPICKSQRSVVRKWESMFPLKAGGNSQGTHVQKKKALREALKGGGILWGC